MSQDQQPFRLQDLPAEIQLIIFEYVVMTDETLLINHPCDSSYDGFTDAYHADKKLWETGVRHPPKQPASTRTCRSIRYDTIPMFYKLNTFQAAYCFVVDLKIVCRWLQAMGPENRVMLRSFRFFDSNPDNDSIDDYADTRRLLHSAFGREMRGSIVSTYSDEGCSHAVTFSLEEDDPMDGLVRLFGDLEHW